MLACVMRRSALPRIAKHPLPSTLRQRQLAPALSTHISSRLLSTSNTDNDKDTGKDADAKAEEAEKQQRAEEEQRREEEERETRQQILQAGTSAKGVMYILGIMALTGLVGGAGYFLFKELFPGMLSPNSVFNRATDAAKRYRPLVESLGEPIKAYGADAGGKREGRRYHVESHSYQAEDGSNRTRVLFNLQGSHGKAAVWAEVSDKMGPDQFVYLVAQDMRTGRMFTIEDNRALAAAGMSVGSNSAMDQLLRGDR